jgi:hypothetical protein
MAALDGLVSGFKKNPKTRRKKIIKTPKYAFVTSHRMRRSFASNSYGNIETTLLMYITGHSKESTFLTNLVRIKTKMRWPMYVCNRRALFGSTIV